MATKAKSTGTPTQPAESAKEAKAPGAGGDLSGRFSQALNLLHSGKRDEAKAALTALEQEAAAHGHLALRRSVHCHLAALDAPAAAAKVPADMEAQMLLNRGDVDGALALVEKALKAEAGRAALHYLKASCHARKGEAEAAAQALRKALEAEPGYACTYRLEPDFESVRNSSPFAALELA